MPQSDLGQPDPKGKLDHSLLMWAILLGGGVLTAAILGYLDARWALPVGILFSLGFLILYALSPSLSREKSLTRVDSEDPGNLVDRFSHAHEQSSTTAHPLTQSAPVLIVDDQQLLDFIAQNPHPQTGQFAALIKEREHSSSVQKGHNA